MSGFYRVCKTNDLPDPGYAAFEVVGSFIILFQVDGNFYALDDVCTHDGGVLSEGVLEGLQIVCPRHGARFDIRTGQALCLPAVNSTKAYEVKVEGNDVFVKIENAESRRSANSGPGVGNGEG